MSVINVPNCSVDYIKISGSNYKPQFILYIKDTDDMPIKLNLQEARLFAFMSPEGVSNLQDVLKKILTQFKGED